MIYAHSRYAASGAEFVVDAAGIPKKVVAYPTAKEQAFSATQHTVSEGERLDLIAAQYYQDPEIWWVIAEANPEVFYPESLAPGTVLRIPRAPSLR